MENFKERNYELFKRYKNGDKTARDMLCTENMRLVTKIVAGFSRYSNMSEDLISVGTIGLLKAIDNFDITLDLQFSTYAVPMILGEIKRFLRDDGMIKVSRKLKTDAGKGFAAREKLIKKLNREPTVREISAECNISEEDLMCAFDAVQEPDSLNKKAFDDSDDEIMDRVMSYNNEEDIINKITVDSILKSVTERERKILILRYFKGRTQEEIACEIGISQVQISRIEKKVLKKIRERETV